MRIPSKEQCYKLMCEMKMMDHIVSHSIQVWRVATFLTDNLNAQKIDLNRDLVQASALLHDITKTRSFTTKESHDFTGAKYLIELGYPEVGNIVRQHVILDEYFVSDIPVETDIVNYADKKVLHDRVVTLNERKNYIQQKYGKDIIDQEKFNWLWEKTQEQEDRIFIYLSFLPEELGDFLDPEDCSAEFLKYSKLCSGTLTEIYHESTKI